MSQTNSAIRDDRFKNEEALISELVEFTEFVNSECRAAVAPYSKAEETYGKKLPFPQFLALSRPRIEKMVKIDLVSQFPEIQSLIENGLLSDRFGWRCMDALFKFRAMVANLVKEKCIVKGDAKSAEFTDICNQIVADMTIYIIQQFDLEDPEAKLDLSFNAYLEKLGVTKDVFYGSLIDMMKGTGYGPYGYEPMCKYSEAMWGVLNSMMTEMEDAHYPLSEEDCADYLNGKITPADLDRKLTKYLSERHQVEINKNVTMANLLSTMDLGD